MPLIAYIIFQVALVEHIEEPGRANHDQGGEDDAIEYSLEKRKKSQEKCLRFCNLDEGNDCICENLTTAFLPWTWFGSICNL